ncbi:hypothetical protein L3X38_004289 [Prunus dulcis]|uniref:Uncharacterized protein n=1 Tax=Prunus dulcis TaxID=3755 RepID=A0AAD4ZNL7_PRUDU|nr:hypothetical protein L3X38_004289 [Prunus dulcis]
MFKFRDDEEDERKTMRYSDSALTGKKTKSFLWEIEIFNRVWKQCMCTNIGLVGSSWTAVLLYVHTSCSLLGRDISPGKKLSSVEIKFD